MIDTYSYFVVGYLVLWVILFSVVGGLIFRLCKIEKRLKS